MEESLKNGGLLPSATALKNSLNQKPDISDEPTMLTPFQSDLLLQGEQEIDESVSEVEETVPFEYSITSYGTDYPVDGLVKRVGSQDIIVPTFQRGYVWSLREASRFVESLLLGLPVPSIFLCKEVETQKLLVIDGQQRLRTLTYFYEGIWPSTRKEFALKGLSSRFEGSTYKTLAVDDRRKLDDSPIHAIIVKQDQPSDDASSIYHIFERLNTSGVTLNPQEIRTAIYHGEFSNLLKELNTIQAWRDIYGPPNKLMRDQELILRFLALYFSGYGYSRPMKGFLNAFMGRNKHLKAISAESMRSVFVPTIETIHAAIGKRAFRLARVLNAAVFDAVMIGVARRLVSGPITDLLQLKDSYARLLEDRSFLYVAERATADEESVSARLRLATDAFSNL
jgi:hypothetical protein